MIDVNNTKELKQNFTTGKEPNDNKSNWITWIFNDSVWESR